ncbi:MAG: S8 family serine peptidase [Cyanobacteria bacterium NC_groundwater_1444_Ag_S-0.65um_54_12]|nr:S8 family serine peptidase [Cyanobacteria bacterium NC_groundwater_1444_Ag_S-0.65um_54_12]
MLAPSDLIGLATAAVQELRMVTRGSSFGQAPESSLRVRQLLLFVLPVVMTASCMSQSVAWPAVDERIVASELIVRFQESASKAERATLRAKYSAIAREGRITDTELWRLPAGTAVAAASRELTSDPLLRYVTLNHRRRTLEYLAPEVNTSSYGQWHLAAIRAIEAWKLYFSAERPPGKGITVAILDSGVDVRHPDLYDNIARDASGSLIFIDVLHEASSSLDNCGNMNFDWQTAYQDAVHPGPDGHGHGTHVAGLVAAASGNDGYNGRNVVGVAPAATILPVKTMNCSGDGNDWDIAYGITAAADRGAKIANLSIGGPDPSPILEDALVYASDKGVLVVVAAGNGSGSPVFYPAAYPGMLAVGAIDRRDNYQAYSNVGPQLALVAPGGAVNQLVEGILSTVPLYISELTRSIRNANGYARISGTSQASPLVAGVAALIWSREPGLSAEQVRDRLIAAAQDLGEVGFDAKYGWGKVDAVNALRLGDHRYAMP